MPPEIDPSVYGLSDGAKFSTEGLINIPSEKGMIALRLMIIKNAPATLKQIIEHLKSSYCSSIGAEFMHLPVKNYGINPHLIFVGGETTEMVRRQNRVTHIGESHKR
jgi:hypothetical protein